MRDIKFQLVWQGAIYEPLTLQELTLGQWEIEGKMYKDFGYLKKGETVSIPRKDYIFYAEDENDFGIWRQFTGLLDKNGKEIWEGDIVTTGPEEWESNYEIVWNPKELCFGMQADEGILQMGFWIDNPHRGLEVIGNIHENPGLLSY